MNTIILLEIFFLFILWGLNVFKNLLHEGDIKKGPGFDKVKSMLNQGDTLIHCTAGADRTGAYVGRYYMDELNWDYEKARSHTKSFGGEKSGSNYKTTREFLKYGPRPWCFINHFPDRFTFSK